MTIQREENICSSDRVNLDKIAVLASCLLRSGKVIAYPTETVYGLGCDYASNEGYQQILQLKGLEEEKPFILLIPDIDWLKKLSPKASGFSLLDELVSNFWPGPLTLILPASPHLPDHLVGSRNLISMRMSPDPFVRALLGSYQRPIISTSANPTGESPATAVSDLRLYFSSHSTPVELVVDDGERRGAPSTLVRISDNTPLVVREGAISASRIYSVCQT